MSLPRLLTLALVPALGCASVAPASLRTAERTAPPAAELQLVESFPVETTLDHPDIPDARAVWPDMVRSARHTLDLAQFYVSNEQGHALEPVIQAIEEAAQRGVRVRLLAEEKFAKTYPETLARLGGQNGIEVRRMDTGALMGGVLHAKYFVVDGREAYFGSQNFDWRSLEHIQELGLRVRVPGVVRALAATFEQDWALAGGAKPGSAPGATGLVGPFTAHYAGRTVEVTPVVSPDGFLPAPGMWDLPQLVRLIDGARSSVRVQLLTYKATGRDGVAFPELEEALKRAAARGVRVELLLADWTKRKGSIEGLQALEEVPGITVKLVTIPRWSGGFVPFARVVHAKYLVVDGQDAWVGTSNWEKDYFTQSRNVGLVVRGAAFARELERFFADTWASPYAVQVDPKATYTPPNVASEN